MAEHRRRSAGGIRTPTVAAIHHRPWITGFDPLHIVAMVELADEPDIRLITNVVDVASLP